MAAITAVDGQDGHYALITVNCDGHPLLSRLHKPDPNLPANAQDKRSLVPLEADQWEQWLHGTEADARALLQTPPMEVFDLSDAHRTDALLAQMALRPASLF